MFNVTICFVFFILVLLSTPLSIFNRINGITSFTNQLRNDYLNNGDYLVVEDRLLYSNFIYAYRDVELTILTPRNPKKPIKSHFQLTMPLVSNFNKNFIYIGHPDSIGYLSDKKKIIKIQETDVLFKKTPIEVYEVLF